MRRWLVLVGLSGLVFLGDKWGWFNWLKRPVAGLSQPVRQRLYGLRVEKKAAIDKEVADEGKAVILEAELGKLRRENERLRELLGSRLPPNWQFVEANILQLKDEVMVIDVGSKMGVAEGEVVMGLVVEEVNNGVLLGKVKTVWPWQSQVELLADEAVEVRVRTEAGAKGKVRGGGGEVRLKEVLQTYQLNEGELILTEGKDGWLPNLVVGRVGQIESEATAVFQETRVVGVVNSYELDKVWVVSLPLED